MSDRVRYFPYVGSADREASRHLVGHCLPLKVVYISAYPMHASHREALQSTSQNMTHPTPNQSMLTGDKWVLADASLDVSSVSETVLGPNGQCAERHAKKVI